jgi:hypothetical protein
VLIKGVIVPVVEVRLEDEEVTMLEEEELILED